MACRGMTSACCMTWRSTLNNQGAANDGKHNPIPHLFWWAWNSNSADTGGLVTEPNWDQV